jgi:hypothetical protein
MEGHAGCVSLHVLCFSIDEFLFSLDLVGKDLGFRCEKLDFRWLGTAPTGQNHTGAFWLYAR